jgi:ATP-dependent Clp protease ATP-binding subunit ClpC
MRLTIAVLIQNVRQGERTVYACQTLRGTPCSAKDASQSAALAKLAGKARKQLSSWIAEGKPQRCAAWLYDPQMKGVELRFPLQLRDRTLRCKVHFVTLPLGDRWLALATTIPEIAFELDSLQALEERAVQVLGGWAQQRIKENLSEDLALLAGAGDVWVESLEVDVEPRIRPKKKLKNILAAMMGQGPVSGAEELHKVGQCLDYMVSDFDTAIGRQAQVDEIDQVLQRRDRQGVLIVGPAAVGKTAIFQECVKRRFERMQSRRRHKPQVWWISPQRLISGMMYLGQWEQRWLAILREAARRDHVLYIEDLAGLYTAGLTRDSRLSAADVLKSFLSEHRVRIVAETTPEELALLRRRDRSLADRFHLVQVPALSASDCLPVLLEATQRLEIRKDIFFHPGVAPLAIRQQEVFAPDRAFPGKAIELIKAVGETERAITPTSLLMHLHKRTGANVRLMHGSLGDQTQIAYQLGSKVIGQADAIAAMARVVVRFTQQLQPGDKPVGVLLFLGPTGVGKTESAKALTELLFRDASHLIRIDMNEITTALAAEQLVGTFDAPEGRLTAAVRRQPHSVILLDEIEKAHPDVFDYLLQVLGEGRLTDARGRIVDFRSSIIIMTSNLGATQQSGSLGFDGESAQPGLVYRRAAERFFRPEFFNRIDETVAFRALEPDDIRQIVLIQLRLLLGREGLKRRHVFVRVEPAALEHVVRVGFDRALGARAVRRALEREIVQPLGDRLSELAVESPVLIRVSREQQRLECQTLELRELAPPETPAGIVFERLVERARDTVARFERRLAEASKQMLGGSPAGAMSESRVAYYALHEQIFRCSSLLKTARHRLSSTSGPRITPVHGSPAAVRRNSTSGRGTATRRMLREWMVDEDLRETLSTEGQELEYLDMSVDVLREQLLANLQLCESMLASIDAPRQWLFGMEAVSRAQQPWLLPSAAAQGRKAAEGGASDLLTGMLTSVPTALQYDLSPEQYFLESLCDCLEQQWQYDVQVLEGTPYRIVSGVAVAGLLGALTGGYVVEGSQHARDLCCLRALPIPAQATPAEIRQILADSPLFTREGFAASATENAGAATIIRGEIGEEVVDFVSGSRLRLTTGRGLGELPGAAEWGRWWTGCLPWPPELSS